MNMHVLAVAAVVALAGCSGDKGNGLVAGEKGNGSTAAVAGDKGNGDPKALAANPSGSEIGNGAPARGK